MNTPSAYPVERLPTLTEVIEWGQTRLPLVGADGEPVPVAERRGSVRPVANDRRQNALPASQVTPAASAVRPAIVHDPLLVERVLEELQQQIDLMLEYRLREAIAPVLARVADNLVREIRTQLASTLRDVVARAVAEELARHRDAPPPR